MGLAAKLFRILLKWLYSAMVGSRRSPSVVPMENGRPKAAGMSDELADRAYSHLKQALDELEESIDKKATQAARGSSPAAAAAAEETQDLNELRAELAELKADIRALRRATAVGDTVPVTPPIQPVADHADTDEA